MSLPSDLAARFIRTILFACIATAPAWAQLEVSTSPSPVGSGARAAGMADAFVAIADDATAASWNPAGLVQLERPEISIVGSYIGLFEHFDSRYYPELDERAEVEQPDLNYLSFVYPLPFTIASRNAAIALNYQRKFDFSREFDATVNLSPVFNGFVLNRLVNLRFEQEGGLSTITPAFAIELTHRLSIGVAINFWRSTFLSQNDWEQTTIQDEFNAFATRINFPWRKLEEHYEDFTGENFVLGALWTPSERWSFGARYDSAFTGEVDYRSTTTTSGLRVSPSNSINVMSRSTRTKLKMRMPETWAIGVAHRMNDRFTLAMDVTTTDWNEFYTENRQGVRTSLVDSSQQNVLLIKARKFDRTYTVRVGGEYVFIPKQPDETLNRLWILRGGLFYDQEPASNKPDDFYGVAAGVGLLLNQHLNLDLAYQFRYGNDVNRDFISGIRDFHEDIFQHRIVASAIFYF